jgi:archaellum component FlaC
VQFKQVTTDLRNVEGSLGNEIKGVSQEITGVKEDVSGVKQVVTGVKLDIKGVQNELRGVQQDIKSEVQCASETILATVTTGQSQLFELIKKISERPDHEKPGLPKFTAATVVPEMNVPP